MTADTPYSTSPRCPHCEQRAILTHRTAEDLAARSDGRLHVFRCPEDLGWHVWYPAMERQP